MKKSKNYSIKKENLLDTLSVFAYYIEPTSMFFELIHEFKRHSCEDCGNKTGADLLFMLMRMFGGQTIKIPHYSELEIYKYLITNSDYCINYIKRNSIQAMSLKIRGDIPDIPDEVNVAELILKFLKTVLPKTGTTELGDIVWKINRTRKAGLQKTMVMRVPDYQNLSLK